jgi:hypothetical protein
MYNHRGWSYSSSVHSTPTSVSAYRRRRLPRLPRLPNFGPVPFAILLVGAAAWYHFGFAGFTVHGSLTDAMTGQPIAGARAWSSRSNTVSTASGAYELTRIKPPEMLSFDAPGYRSNAIRVTNPFEPVPFHLEPIGVDISVVDAEDGQPLDANLDGASAADSQFHVAPVHPGQEFAISANGYAPVRLAYAGEDMLRASLRPNLTGRVTDAVTGKPVSGARIAIGDLVLNTDSGGGYQLQHRPANGHAIVLAPGYRRADLDVSHRGALDVQLQPNAVRGVYMTYFAIGGDEYRQAMYRMLDSTEVNAVVIDIKGDYGLLSYKSAVPLADRVGANSAPTIDDLDDLLHALHAHGAYVIGRIVVFKDTMLAHNGSNAGLDVSVKDRRTGDLWQDGESLAWVDPFQSAAWDYNTALAREAIVRGFDEVQFDYIRFPTDPSPDSSIGDIVYSKPFNEENRVAALNSFLHQAHAAVNDAGGFLSMDTFGYTTWWDDDGGIGQDLAILADNIDYYSPMVYPSTFNAGIPGAIPYPDVVARPYDTVYQSLKHAQQKLSGKRVVVRPWLQYFDDYPWATKTRYDAAQIEAQKRAVVDSQSLGWLMWNAGSLFTRGGLSPKP